MILGGEAIFIFDSKIVEEDRKNWVNMREVFEQRTTSSVN